MNWEGAGLRPPPLTGLLIAIHRVLPHRPILAVSSRTQAYLVLVLPYSPITGITGISKGTGSWPAGGAPFPNPAEGLWWASPFQTVADSFQPCLQLRLTE